MVVNLNADSILKHRYSWAFTVVAFLLFALSLWGAFDQGWWRESGWTSAPASSLFITTVVILLFMGAAGLAAGLALPLLLLLPLMIVVGLVGIGPVAAVFWFWICATIIGAALLSACNDKSSTIWSVRNSGIGFAVLGTVISLMSHFPINTPLVYLILITGSAFFSAWRIGIFNSRVDSCLSHLLARRKRTTSEICVQSLIIVGVTLMLLATSIPEMGHDALAVHLTIPARILESKRWNYDVTEYIWSVMPFGANWLMLPPYFLAGEHAAKLMDTSFLLATAWLSYRILIPRIGFVAALAAPALLLTLPITMLLSISVFAEPVITFLFLLALAELTGTADQRNGSWLYMGVVVGYLVGSKLLGAPLIPILAVAASIRSWQGKFQKISLGIVSAAILAFIIFSIHPYIVAYFKTGNPLFPFYNTIFKSEYFTTQSVFNNGHAFANPFYLHPLSFNMLWESSIKSRVYGEFGADGAIGVVFLVLIPLAIIISVLVRSWWVLGGTVASFAYCVLVFQTQAYLRYVYQIFPWFIVFGVWALAHISRPVGARTLLVVLICLVSLYRYPTGGGSLGQFSPLQMVDRDAYRAILENGKPAVIVGDIIQKIGSLRNKKILIVGTDPVYSHFPAGTIAFSWHSWPFFSSPDRDTNFKKLVRESNVELIVHPIGQNEPHEKDVLSMTDELIIVNGIRVGVVTSNSVYEVEKVKGTDLTSVDPAWQLNKNLIKDGGVWASVSRPIVQFLDVKDSQKGLLEIKVFCPKGRQFRSQINWIDAPDGINNTDIQVHECQGSDSVIQRLVEIPNGVKVGAIFGSSHDENPVLFKSISFRTMY
jgi:Dolichyl-phosphate-mannose-protein mannosyltransferase